MWKIFNLSYVVDTVGKCKIRADGLFGQKFKEYCKIYWRKNMDN
jgi:hypothetical protein